MKKRILLMMFCSFLNKTFSQIKEKDFRDRWNVEYLGESYKSSDTIILTKNLNGCNLTIWDINKTELEFSRFNSNCDNETQKKYNYKFSNTDIGKIFSIIQNNKIIDKFRIAEYGTKESFQGKDYINSISLLRFDSENENKLYKHVNYLITNVLKYNPNEKKHLEDIIINDSNSENVKIRCVPSIENGNFEPLIIINGHIVENKQILKSFLLIETYAIIYLNKHKASAIYGSRAINGVIIINISEKIFKTKWKSTTGNTV